MDMREMIRAGRTNYGEKVALPWAFYEFSKQFPGFDGHFPGQPVLPGVCMLKAVAAALEDWHGQGIRVEELRKARFLSPIRPGQPLEVKCVRHEETSEGFTAHMTLRGGGDRKTSDCIVRYRLRESTEG